MSLKLVDFDPVDYLKTEEAISEFLKAAQDGNDENHLARAQQIAEKARCRNAQTKHGHQAVTTVTVRWRQSLQRMPSWVRPESFQSSYSVAP